VSWPIAGEFILALAFSLLSLRIVRRARTTHPSFSLRRRQRQRRVERGLRYTYARPAATSPLRRRVLFYANSSFPIPYIIPRRAQPGAFGMGRPFDTE
jgi:hypothetical protein